MFLFKEFQEFAANGSDVVPHGAGRGIPVSRLKRFHDRLVKIGCGAAR